MRKAKGKRQNVTVFVGLSFVFFLCFVGNSFAQTDEQLKFYADRLEFGEAEVRRDALFALRNFESEKASRVAVSALKDPSEIIRATATHTIIFLPKTEAARILLPLLNDESEFVRRETAYALGKVGNPDATRPLTELLKQDKQSEVRTACAVALGQIGEVSAVEELANILEKKPKKKEEFLRRASARSIGQIAENLQIRLFSRATPESFLPEKHKFSTKLKYQDMSENFPVFRKIAQVLIKNLQNRKEFQDTKRETAFALGAIGDKSAIPVLQMNLNNSDYYLVEICKEALKKINR